MTDQERTRGAVKSLRKALNLQCSQPNTVRSYGIVDQTLEALKGE